MLELLPLLLVCGFALVDEGDARAAVVVERSTDVFHRPDPRAFVTASLGRGARVMLRADRPDGWSLIEPSADDFEWIDASHLKSSSAGDCVAVEKTVLRAGCASARLPGPPGTVLRKGDFVRRLDRPELVLKGKSSATTWVAIEAPASAGRYVRTKDVRPLRLAQTSADLALLPAKLDDPPLPAEVADELVRIDASRRSVLREPLDAWELAPVLARYQALLRSTADPTARGVISRRIESARTQAELAASAKKFAAALSKSRKRDLEVEQVRIRLEGMKQNEREAYTAVGLVQPSSKELEGRRLHLLIGPDGANVAYLDIPQGIDVGTNPTRRVGVRGTLRYDEKLGARYIVVRELEPLDSRE